MNTNADFRSILLGVFIAFAIWLVLYELSVRSFGQVAADGRQPRRAELLARLAFFFGRRSDPGSRN